MVVFPLSKLSLLDSNLNWIITKSNMADKLILSVGSSIMLINSTALYYESVINSELSGMLSINSDGTGLRIDGLTNVIEVTTIN